MPILNKMNSEEVKRYNDFVRNSAFSSATQDINWSLVKSNWDNEQVYIERNGKIVAAISLLIKRVLKEYSMIYAPRGPVCNIYDTEIVEELVKEIDTIAKKYHAFMLRFDPEVLYDKELEDIYNGLGYTVRNIQYGKNELIQPRYNMILNIEDCNEEKLMKKFSKKTRYNIRLADRKGVKITYSTSDKALKIFYNLYQTTTERNDIGKRPFQYFKNMRNAYGENLRIYIGEHEGDYLSAAITINYGDKVWYAYGASSNQKRNLMPNNLMQFEMIKWGLETGAKKYDFGGVFEFSKENGLYRFKEGFCRNEGVTEFIGEFDKVYKPVIYYSFTRLIPLAPKIKKRLQRK